MSRYVKAVSSKDGSTWEIDRAMGAGIRDRILHVAGDQSFSHKTDDARLFSTGEVEAVCSCFARLKTYVDARGTHAEPPVEDTAATDQPSMPSAPETASGELEPDKVLAALVGDAEALQVWLRIMQSRLNNLSVWARRTP